MHGISVHSALAIKRQRKRRADAERSRRRSTRRGSNSTLAQYLQTEQTQGGAQTANKVIGTVTMLHIGGIFTLIGILLLLGAVLTTQSASEMAELIGTGVICLVIGIFLIILNSIYGKREEEDLTHYVEARLARTQSGQRLFHESESSERMIGAMPSATLPGLTNRSSDSIGSRSQHKLVLHLRPPNTTSSPPSSPRACHERKLFFQLSVVLPLLGSLLLFLSTCTPLFENGTLPATIGLLAVIIGLAITPWRLGWLGGILGHRGSTWAACGGPCVNRNHNQGGEEQQGEFQDVELTNNTDQQSGGEKG